METLMAAFSEVQPTINLSDELGALDEEVLPALEALAVLKLLAQGRANIADDIFITIWSQDSL